MNFAKHSSSKLVKDVQSKIIFKIIDKTIVENVFNV